MVQATTLFSMLKRFFHFPHATWQELRLYMGVSENMGVHFCSGLSLDLRPLTVWESLILLLQVPNA